MLDSIPDKQGLYDSAFEHDSCGIGFVANIKGGRSHDIIERGMEVLERMAHRGAESADNKTGDGAGMIMQIPHRLYKQEIPSLPEPGQYGTGIVFLPRREADAAHCVEIFERTIAEEGLRVVSWREIVVDNSAIGDIARASEPIMRQVFITGDLSPDALERKLYVVRKLTESRVRAANLPKGRAFYICTLSTKRILYKGMLTSLQLRGYFADLRDPRTESAIALVHSRFSTNTFPSWDLAQPFRVIAHNGEINTIKGNRFWIHTAESGFESPLFGDDVKKLLPIIEPGKSDSASFDNVLELLIAAGRSLPHALMMLIPESFNKFNPIPDDLKYFYEYHSAFMEPWDGPASIIFCDGRYVGGTLDRNGLRPSRYVITKDGLIVMASEVGVQTFAPEQVESKGRLRPGKLLLVDTEEGRIIPDSEIKDHISHQKPYTQWVKKHRVRMDDIPVKASVTVGLPEEQLRELQLLYGYHLEDIEKIILPMLTAGEEPTSSMGNDTPLAVFSERPQRLFNYFKQVFAQVTNPPIDSYREELVMTLTSYIGKEGNLLGETPEHTKTIQFKKPIFTNLVIQKLLDWNNPDFRIITLPMTFPVGEGPAALEKALDKLCQDSENCIDAGYSFIILSDKSADVDNAPIPSLLACSSVHHHLVRAKKRTKTALIIQTAEAREVMHFALLFGYGASAINPYGAFAVINGLLEEGKLPSISNYVQAEENYVHAIDKGVLKVLSKLGISTLRSYHGSQTFEAIGLSKAVVHKHFTGTESRIGGIGLEEIAREVLLFHHKAYVERPARLEFEGIYQYRRDGEKHAWNPETIHLLQWAVRSNDYNKYKEFASLVNKQNQRPHVIRGLLDFKPRTPIPIEEVEPASEIFKRLTTGAMSFGSISKAAHETIAIAMNTIGGRSNSGEGGEDPERYLRRPDGTSTRSAIKQIASARFGVTSNYLVNADELQIKIAQGAKPGEGGQLPGSKVDKHIARTRHSTPGVTLISPPPHHDIYSIEDLKQLIFDLKNGNPEARISVKLVSEAGVGTIAAGVAKAHADTIIICGYDGGTGASPQSSIKHAGLPFELGISETNQTLVLNGLRGRVRLQTDGQLKTGRDIVLAAMLGAEEFAFGTATVISLGCVMMRKCHLNTCPVGVATHDPELTKRFAGKPEHLINYFTFMIQEVREIMAQLGVRKFEELVGRTDLLEQRKVDHWKARTVDLSDILYRPEQANHTPNHCVETQIHKIDDVLDRTLIEKADAALKFQTPVCMSLPITNSDRAVGAMLSSKISRLCGEAGFPDDTINCTFYGSAGQSFAAFLAKGITFRLVGDSNDYLGKSLSGGRVIVVPPEGSTFQAEENIIVGNTLLYGATSGEVFIRGVAGERFCVRNSGAIAVIEGTGDHGAEYMTGGRVIVLGKVGRNFAAGMSGGIAYVLNTDGNFPFFCNTSMVELSAVLDQDDQDFLRTYLEKHLEYTQSPVAQTVLNNWHAYLPKFMRVLPLEFKRVLQERKLAEIDQQLAYIRREAQLEGRY
ncbi:MAG TPA: glutamate synthase large subunit [Aggregatilineales bacterium]|nr:glutamate synthase large subunit [Aggregatilineales bacterium]